MRCNKILLPLSVAVVITLLAIVAPAMRVFGAVGTVTISPTSGVVNVVVTVNGTGFTVGTTYQVMFDSTVVSSGTVPAGGAITTTFNVPAAARGSHNVTISTNAVPADSSNAAVFTVTSDITITPSTGYGGETITISGTGFYPSYPINITFDGTNIGSATTSTNGSFTGLTATTPQSYRGAHTIVGTDGIGSSPSYTFTISPKMTLSPVSAAIGSSLTATGTGFLASSPISFYIDDVIAPSVTTSTGAAGNFTLNVTVPAVSYGSHSLRATDSGGSSASATFSTTQSMTVKPQAGGVGTPVTISGQGFSSNASITISFGGSAVQNVTSDVGGNFSASFTVPASTAAGVNAVTASDGTVISNANFTVVTMNINPQSGAPDMPVQITGQGFGASKRITVTFKGANVPTNPPAITADASGNFTATLIVPHSGGGSGTVMISDGTTSSTANFDVVSIISTPSVDRGPVGTTTVIKGAGVVPGVNIAIKWDAGQITQVAAGANGDFTANLKVPPSKAGAHTITVTEGKNTKTFPFTVVASASLTQSSGNVSTDVTITGTGFNAGATLNVNYDGNKITSSAVDADGNFTANFKAPASKGGNHTIIATDGTNSISSTFMMELTPPPVPLLKSPTDDTKSEALPSFAWAAVSDPSGVTYVFQLATDSDFNDVVLEKKDLANPAYKLIDAEKLKSRTQKEPYFWRVKAIDGASNESGWSAPFTFFVGFVLPPWGMYVIYGLGGLILLAVGFFIGKASAGY